jgi:hypothetical protein
MADVKISALGAISAVAGEDLVAIVDDPSGTPASRKATITQIATFINASAITASSTTTFTNKTIDADGTGNSITNIENANIKASAGIDATKLADGTVTSTELQYINSLSSNAQTQISAKSPIASPTFTGTVVLPNVPAIVTTQLDLKAPLASPALTGTATGVNLTLSGDLTVNGTTSTINSTTLTVDDKNIEMGSVATPSDTTANGGGITLKGATDKTIIWDSTNSNFTSNQDWNIASGKVFKVNNVDTLTATALGSAVVGSSLTSVGTIGTGVWQGTAIADGYLGTGINANKIADGSVTSTEFQYINTLSSNAQTQISAKSPIASPTFTGTVTTASLDVAGNNIDNVQNIIHDISTTGLDVDFSEDQLQTYSVSGNVTFTTFQNITAGKSKTIRVSADGTDRVLTFPANIRWLGTAPDSNTYTVTANKMAILTFTSFSTDEANILGVFALEE